MLLRVTGNLRNELHCLARRQRGRLPTQGAGRTILQGVARGLHWLHANGILHRDVQPSKGVFRVIHAVGTGNLRQF